MHTAHRLIGPAAGGAILLAAFAASAQPAAPPPLAIQNPTYFTMVLEMPVDRPAAAVWARVGKFCDLGEAMHNSCSIISGDQSQLGAVRRLGAAVIEMMVGKTDLSYTYTQPVRAGVPFNAYHATLEARPVTPTTSKLVYSFFYDTSMMPDAAARTAEAAARKTRFTGALQNLKILAEGGKLPPAP